MFAWIAEMYAAFRPLLWVGIGLMLVTLGMLCNLVALKDPDAMTLSQIIREFNTWSPSSVVLSIVLPVALGVLFLAWYVLHILDLNSP